ncbi:MAG: sigma-70 family RNA polymerase sigma factor [Kofleriaceae bacterium]
MADSPLHSRHHRNDHSAKKAAAEGEGGARRPRGQHQPARIKRRAAAKPPAASAAPTASTDPALAAIMAAKAETARADVRREAREARVDDDHLSAYFRNLAEHDLLSPDDERRLSQAIEDQEILTWELVLGRAEIVEHVTALVLPNLEEPLKVAHLPKVLGQLATRPGRDARARKKHAALVRTVADALRAADLDRFHIDAVLRELERAAAAAREQETWWEVAASADGQAFLEEVRRAHRGGANLRDEFVRANLRLVVTMARRYDRGGMPLADLIQEGNLGLMHAVARFDYRRGLRFSTYACWWIRHAIGRALADKARAVRIPVHMLEAQQQLEKVRQSLVADLGRPPTPQELAKAARLPLAKLNQMHRYIMGAPISLDRPVHDDDDRAFGDTMADPETENSTPADDLTTQTLTKQVKRLIGHLSPIEADVLTKRFGLGDDEERTFREIGDQYHLSRERIRQIQNGALDKLKRALEREHRGHVEM